MGIEKTFTGFYKVTCITGALLVKWGEHGISCKGRDERKASECHNKSNSGGVGIIGCIFSFATRKIGL